MTTQNSHFGWSSLNRISNSSTSSGTDSSLIMDLDYFYFQASCTIGNHIIDCTMYDNFYDFYQAVGTGGGKQVRWKRL